MLSRHLVHFYSSGQEHQAREALKRLRNTPHIEDDIDEMRAEEVAQQAEAQITLWELLRSPSLRMPLTIAVVMQLSQQLSGIELETKVHVKVRNHREGP